VATKAQFIPGKPAKFKALKGWEVSDIKLDPPRSTLKSNTVPRNGSAPPYNVSDQDAVLTQDGKVKLGTFGKWRKIPADQALQARVRRVGMSVVPAYQKQMPANDPSKIHFLFYAVDMPKIRSEICSTEGLILIPEQAVKRLKSDDQLAAVLADGVAYNLQRQAARLIVDSRVLTGAYVAGQVAGAFVPGLDLAELAGGASAASEADIRMEEQRGRVALSLMAGAGYNPWAAPEAWRLLAPKELPKNLDSLKYPRRSEYQLSILHLKYRKAEVTLGGAQMQAAAQEQ
jgi:hypothetical protein